MKKIIVFTDMDSNGSGYRNICVPLFNQMATLDYEIKIVGLMNRGEEHNYPFAIIPAQTVEEGQVIVGNLCQLWFPDVIVVALDLPMQVRLHQALQPFLKRTPQEETQTPRKYIAITPLENGPLCMDWAVPLFQMDAVYFISELGKQEALKVGVKADHLQVGVDTVSWRPPFPEERKQLREGLGISQDTFVVLTVADNQERKNLWAAMKAISLLKKSYDVPIKYILVTREQSPFGWRLRSLAVSLGINQEYMPFERGMPQHDLWGLYAIADVYLQTSKAEGFGMPLLEAMACKIPVIATDTGAMHELLTDGRGVLCPSDYTIEADVWGNEKRDLVSVDEVAANLLILTSKDFDRVPAYEYVQSRTWDVPANQLDSKIRELYNEPKTETPK